jgi:hypothetical protein
MPLKMRYNRIEHEVSHPKWTAMCSCTAKARRASWDELLGIKSEPTEWLGIIPNIEPRMVLRIDGNPVAL